MAAGMQLREDPACGTPTLRYGDDEVLPRCLPLRGLNLRHAQRSPRTSTTPSRTRTS